MNVQQTHCACRGYGVLYHQWRTYQAEAPIIINTSNTGTGKTKAALLRLKRRAEKRGFTKLNSTRDNVLFVAPTNELVQQHAKDARAFSEENILPYRVNPLTREALDLFIGESQKRRGFEFASLLRDSSRIDQDFTKRADLWVVNPDIFYYAITFRYNQFDRGPL